MSNQQLQNSLEKLINCEGLDTVLGTLAEICREKGDHIRTNWQDEKLAKAWEKNATAIERIQSKIERMA